MAQSKLLKALLAKRGILDSEISSFLNPRYEVVESNDPYLLPDMQKAVDRLEIAYLNQEHILIFGDYDVDGVTSTALLLDGFNKLGFKNISYQLPNRFKHGYGMNGSIIESIAPRPDLIVTVDCGSLNHSEVKLARSLDIDVIITDHHNVAEIQPDAVAVINPKRKENLYPNRDLAGVGVAFNLIRALNMRLGTIPSGQEKWLLDLVSFGTIADMMDLRGENRVLTHFGLKVLNQTKRLGLREMLLQAKIEPGTADSSTIGFVLGPRFNAAGRLESADLALNVLTAKNSIEAKDAVDRLEYLNQKRRAIQDRIFDEASQKADVERQNVLVLSNRDWHEGVVGIVASKILEKYHRPTFILEINGDIAKGSARSSGNFSIYKAISESKDLIISGGGHDFAGGVKIETTKINEFKQRLNSYYDSLEITDDAKNFIAEPDLVLDDFSELTLDFYNELVKMEPFGTGNPEPVFQVSRVTIDKIWHLGKDLQHLKLKVLDSDRRVMTFLLFSDAKSYSLKTGDKISIVFNLVLNSWQGKKDLEGKIISISGASDD